MAAVPQATGDRVPSGEMVIARAGWATRDIFLLSAPCQDEEPVPSSGWKSRFLRWLCPLRAGEATFYGFALAQRMRERHGSRSLTSHGTLYKALGRLEEFGLLTSRWEDAATVEGRPRRWLYELTGAGVLAAQAETAPETPVVRPTPRLA